MWKPKAEVIAGADDTKWKVAIGDPSNLVI